MISGYTRTHGLTYKYNYFDSVKEKTITKGFTLPTLRLDLTEEEITELLKAIDKIVERPEKGEFYGEWTDTKEVYPIINKN